MTPKATIIISFFNSCPFRKRNFDFLFSHLSCLEIPFIVSEQIAENSKENIIVERKFNCTHIKYYSNSLFKKSFLYNIASKYVDTKYLWFLDADVFIPFEDVLPILKNQKAIRPFSSIFQLNQEDSYNFTNGLKVDFEKYEKDNFYGKHSLIIRKDIFLKSEGFDEKFIGWGWEDLDFVQQKLYGVEPFIIDSLNGVHLYHPVSKKRNERNNYFTFLENKGLRKKISYCFWGEVLSDINLNNLSKSLENNLILKNDIEFCLVLFGERYENIINWVNLNLSKYINQNYLNIFLCTAKPKDFSDKINNTIYPAQGKLVSIWDQSNCISLSNSNQGLLTNVFKPSENLTFIKRVAIDHADGYDYCNSMIDCNTKILQKIKKYTTSELGDSVKVSKFGNRDSFMFYNWIDLRFCDL